MQNGLGVEKDLYEAVRSVNVVKAKAKGVEEVEEPKIASAAVWIGTNLVGRNGVEHSNFVSLFLSLFFPKSPFHPHPKYYYVSVFKWVRLLTLLSGSSDARNLSPQRSNHDDQLSKGTSDSG